MSQSSDQDPKLESMLRLSALVDGEAESAHVAGLCMAWKDDESARRTWHTYQLIGDALRSDDLATDPARDCAFMERLRARLADEPVVFAPRSVDDEAQEISAAGLAYVEPRIRVAGGGSGAVTAGRAAIARSSGARRWRMPLTVAASVLAVTGVLSVARVSGFLPADGQQQPGQQQQAIASAGTSQTAAQQPAPQSFAAVATAPDSGLQTVSAPGGPVDAQGSLSAVQPQTVIASGKLIRDARLDQYLAAHKQFGGSTALGVPSGFLRSATSESAGR